VKTILYDLNGPYTVDKIKEIEHLFEDLEDVSILINNAGVLSLNKVENLNIEQTLRNIYVNTFPIPIITKILLPKMLARKHKGAVITVSSVAGFELGKPGLSIYSATKGFALRFS